MATYDDPKIKAMDEKVDHYYTLMKDEGKLFAGAPPYPFHAQVREATAPYFYEAITGELSPQEALDKMAAAAEDEMKKLGYRK
jgi:multiple sugar transport system substrate-binding protein